MCSKSEWNISWLRLKILESDFILWNRIEWTSRDGRTDVKLCNVVKILTRPLRDQHKKRKWLDFYKKTYESCEKIVWKTFIRHHKNFKFSRVSTPCRNCSCCALLDNVSHLIFRVNFFSSDSVGSSNAACAISQKQLSICLIEQQQWTKAIWRREQRSEMILKRQRNKKIVNISIDCRHTQERIILITSSANFSLPLRLSFVIIFYLGWISLTPYREKCKK